MVISIDNLDPSNPGDQNNWLNRVAEFDTAIDGQDFDTDNENVLQLSRLYEVAGEIDDVNRVDQIQDRIESTANTLAARANNYVYGSEEEQATIQGNLEILATGQIVHCFAAGTLIATSEGEVLVETLQVDDSVLTASGETVSVKWVGRHTVSNATANPDRQPVRVRAGALGDGKPHKDLVVIAGHGLVIDDLVINAAALINGSTIDYMPWDELDEIVTYYHIETESHEVLLANGVQAESYIDYIDRQSFDNYAEYVALYGLGTRIIEMPRHRISARRLLPLSIRQRLGISEEIRKIA